MASERGGGVWTGATAEPRLEPCRHHAGRLFAPGQEIRSAHNATDTATRVLKGTSMASPHVAGAAALLLADQPALTPAEVAAKLIGSATADAIRADTLLGSPNRLLYVEHPPAPAGRAAGR